MASSSSSSSSPADPPVFQKAPPLDPAWLAHEREANLLAPKPVMDPIQRQATYAVECRRLNAAMMAEGARDHHLSQGITTQYVYARVSPSAGDDDIGGGGGGEEDVDSSTATLQIPLLRYDREAEAGTPPDWVIVYYHGGGLLVGEADSEDLSCRRLLRATEGTLPRLRLYSVGYRLKPQHPARVCVADSLAAFRFAVADAHANNADNPSPPNSRPGPRVVVVGSSSGGALAALVTQRVHPETPFHGVLLRCPVTSDAFRGEAYVPARFRAAGRRLHTSAGDASFRTALLARLDTDGPRDGLPRMPLEAPPGELAGMPRTWVQLCTNDALYSDGACYAVLLREAGVEVRTDVVHGWPHTFWLKAPQLARALEADEAMVRGLEWIAGVGEE